MVPDVFTLADARPPISISVRRRKGDGNLYWGKRRPEGRPRCYSSCVGLRRENEFKDGYRI